LKALPTKREISQANAYKVGALLQVLCERL